MAALKPPVYLSGWLSDQRSGLSLMRRNLRCWHRGGFVVTTLDSNRSFFSSTSVSPAVGPLRRHDVCQRERYR